MSHATDIQTISQFTALGGRARGVCGPCGHDASLDLSGYAQELLLKDLRMALGKRLICTKCKCRRTQVVFES